MPQYYENFMTSSHNSSKKESAELNIVKSFAYSISSQYICRLNH